MKGRVKESAVITSTNDSPLLQPCLPAPLGTVASPHSCHNAGGGVLVFLFAQGELTADRQTHRKTFICLCRTAVLGLSEVFLLPLQVTSL